MSLFVETLLDILTPLGEVKARGMFGGHGFYKDGLMFALEASQRFYIKVDDASRPAFEAKGCQPFMYRVRDGKKLTMSYYEPPDEAFSNERKMLPWARLGVEAAMRAQVQKKKKKKRKLSKPAKKSPTGKKKTIRLARSSKQRGV